MKKKIGLIMSIVVLFVFVFSGVKNTYVASAEENTDFVIGTENLNNTSENSAKMGDTLLQPEKGWKRYDDTNKNILYNDWIGRKAVGKYKDTDHATTKIGAYLKFNFIGDKLRILSQFNMEDSANVIIKIDGKQYNYKVNSGNRLFDCCIAFEKLGLTNSEHSVEIINDGDWLNLDAIDIDKDGELKPYNENITQSEIKAESITLDKTSMDLLDGSSDKLTATVLPEDATNKKVIWSSSDESIAKVDENGTVTAIKEGQATITAKVENTDLTATCKVNVTKPVEESKNNAILSISLVNGATKEYDVSMEEVEKFINWFEERSSGNGPSLYSFNKKISPYKSVKEYIVHDKIASFEVREYEATK